jgi:hypothetical protein
MQTETFCVCDISLSSQYRNCISFQATISVTRIISSLLFADHCNIKRQACIFDMLTVWLNMNKWNKINKQVNKKIYVNTQHHGSLCCSVSIGCVLMTTSCCISGYALFGGLHAAGCEFVVCRLTLRYIERHMLGVGNFRLKWNLLKNFEVGFQFCHHSWRFLGDSILKVVFSERRIGKLDSCNSNWRLNLALMINQHSCMYNMYIYIHIYIYIRALACMYEWLLHL